MDVILNLLASSFDGGKASLHQCGLTEEDAKSTDELLSRAEKELNVFPFSAVEIRWLKLYADVRLLRAQQILRNFRDGFDITQSKDEKLLSDATAELDYALIVAGGGNEKRRKLVHRVLALLSGLIRGRSATPESDDEERPSKRQRVDDTSIGKQLPADLSPLPVISTPVHHMSRPSLTQFEVWANETREPVVLRSILDHWPALQTWKDSKYWLNQTLGGRRLVPVELGQSYHDEDWRQQIMPFRDFLSRYILTSDEEREEIGYLAQHDLFGQIDGLRKDFAIPDFCYCEMSGDKANGHDDAEQTEPEVHQNIWFGGRTISPLHHDPYHNILCQVHGTKYIRLYSPEHTNQLYPRSKTEAAPHMNGQAGIEQKAANKPVGTVTSGTVDTLDAGGEPAGAQTIDMSNNSSVDIFAMELSPHEDWDEKWPGISEVPFYECILREGEALYIPKGWWHYVRGLSSSGISISFWW